MLKKKEIDFTEKEPKAPHYAFTLEEKTFGCFMWFEFAEYSAYWLSFFRQIRSESI